MNQISDIILFQDHQVIVMNKPPGMPVQEDKTGDPSLLRMAMAYCKQDLYLVNRLDRPCSGIVLMAKNKKAAGYLSELYKKREISKTYLAIADKPVEPPAGSLEHILVRESGKNKITALTDEDVEGTHVKMQYTVKAESDTLAFLEITTDSGGQHQLRAQLGAAGHPIRGDNKYGYKRGNRDRSIQLHAWKLQFRHPSKHVNVDIQCPPPAQHIWNIFQDSM